MHWNTYRRKADKFFNRIFSSILRNLVNMVIFFRNGYSFIASTLVHFGGIVIAGSTLWPNSLGQGVHNFSPLLEVMALSQDTSAYVVQTVQAQLPICRAWWCQHPDINPSNVSGSSAGQCTDVCTSRATPVQPEFLPPTTDEDSSQITHRRCRQDHGPCLCHESDRLL